MFLKLCDKSFVKSSPGSYSYSFFKNGKREFLKINESAYNILKLCSGKYSMEDIVSFLLRSYDSGEDEVRGNVENFLRPLIVSSLVEIVGSGTCDKIERGNREICFPDAIMWEITDCCPLECRHCYLGDKSGIAVSRENVEKVFGLIEKSGVFQVQITGGEALTHPSFGYILNFLIDRGIIISVSTSGIVLNDKILKSLSRLREVGGSVVRVSLDGNEKTHNFIRNNNLSYKRAIMFIKEVIENKIECQVSTTVTNQPRDEIEELTSMVKNLGVSLIEIGLIINKGDALKNGLMSRIEIEQYSAFLHYLSSKYNDSRFSVKIPSESNQKNCGAGSKMIAIKPNMDITPCVTSDLVLGNLEKQSIDEIMSNCGKKFHDFVAPSSDLCRGCKNEKICRNCMVQGLIQKNTVKHCKWYESQKVVLKQFSR